MNGLLSVRGLVSASFLLALAVVVLGAFVRLSDAGLGCPDWPGCYGQLLVPEGQQAAQANDAWPQRPLETGKAWKEMIHRYAAGLLGIAVLMLAIASWRKRAVLRPLLPTVLLVLIVFQALLGMWTVTLLLKPAVVVAHLLGGFTTLSLLWLLQLHFFASAHRQAVTGGLRTLAWLSLVVLAAQIILGGWTSSNYAALACVDFPTCRQSWWPPTMDFVDGFVLWRGLGVDYEGGVLGDDARVAIHFTHRVGAVVASLVLLALSLTAIAMRSSRAIMRAGVVVGLLLLAQVSLGIGNVVLSLPLTVATAHNAVAALLLLSVVTLIYLVHGQHNTP